MNKTKLAPHVIEEKIVYKDTQGEKNLGRKVGKSRSRQTACVQHQAGRRLLCILWPYLSCGPPAVSTWLDLYPEPNLSVSTEDED